MMEQSTKTGRKPKLLVALAILGLVIAALLFFTLGGDDAPIGNAPIVQKDETPQIAQRPDTGRDAAPDVIPATSDQTGTKPKPEIETPRDVDAIVKNARVELQIRILNEGKEDKALASLVKAVEVSGSGHHLGHESFSASAFSLAMSTNGDGRYLSEAVVPRALDNLLVKLNLLEYSEISFGREGLRANAKGIHDLGVFDIDLAQLLRDNEVLIRGTLKHTSGAPLGGVNLISYVLKSHTFALPELVTDFSVEVADDGSFLEVFSLGGDFISGDNGLSLQQLEACTFENEQLSEPLRFLKRSGRVFDFGVAMLRGSLLRVDVMLPLDAPLVWDGTPKGERAPDALEVEMDTPWGPHVNVNSEFLSNSGELKMTTPGKMSTSIILPPGKYVVRPGLDILFDGIIENPLEQSLEVFADEPHSLTFHVAAPKLLALEVREDGKIVEDALVAQVESDDESIFKEWLPNVHRFSRVGESDKESGRSAPDWERVGRFKILAPAELKENGQSLLVTSPRHRPKLVPVSIEDRRLVVDLDEPWEENDDDLTLHITLANIEKLPDGSVLALHVRRYRNHVDVVKFITIDHSKPDQVYDLVLPSSGDYTLELSDFLGNQGFRTGPLNKELKVATKDGVLDHTLEILHGREFKPMPRGQQRVIARCEETNLSFQRNVGFVESFIPTLGDFQNLYFEHEDAFQREADDLLVLGSRPMIRVRLSDAAFQRFDVVHIQGPWDFRAEARKAGVYSMPRTSDRVSIVVWGLVGEKRYLVYFNTNLSIEEGDTKELSLDPLPTLVRASGDDYGYHLVFVKPDGEDTWYFFKSNSTFALYPGTYRVKVLRGGIELPIDIAVEIPTQAHFEYKVPDLSKFAAKGEVHFAIDEDVRALLRTHDLTVGASIGVVGRGKIEKLNEDIRGRLYGDIESGDGLSFEIKEKAIIVKGLPTNQPFWLQVFLTDYPNTLAAKPLQITIPKADGEEPVPLALPFPALLATTSESNLKYPRMRKRDFPDDYHEIKSYVDDIEFEFYVDGKPIAKGMLPEIGVRHEIKLWRVGSTSPTPEVILECTPTVEDLGWGADTHHRLQPLLTALAAERGDD